MDTVKYCILINYWNHYPCQCCRWLERFTLKMFARIDGNVDNGLRIALQLWWKWITGACLTLHQSADTDVWICAVVIHTFLSSLFTFRSPGFLTLIIPSNASSVETITGLPITQLSTALKAVSRTEGISARTIFGQVAIIGFFPA